MKRIVQILALFLVICITSKSYAQTFIIERDTNTFEYLFNYAYSNKIIDSTKYNQLTLNLPESCITYHYYKDSLIYFTPFNECECCVDYRFQDFITFSIDSLGNTTYKYGAKIIESASSFIKQIHDSSYVYSFDLPSCSIYKFGIKKYTSKNTYANIYVNIQTNDFDLAKKQWEELFRILTEFEEIINSIKEIKSNSIYKKKYCDLSPKKKNNIDLLVPLGIRISFWSGEITTPPLLNTTKITALATQKVFDVCFKSKEFNTYFTELDSIVTVYIPQNSNTHLDSNNTYYIRNSILEYQSKENAIIIFYDIMITDSIAILDFKIKNNKYSVNITLNWQNEIEIESIKKIE